MFRALLVRLRFTAHGVAEEIARHRVQAARIAEKKQNRKQNGAEVIAGDHNNDKSVQEI